LYVHPGAPISLRYLLCERLSSNKLPDLPQATCIFPLFLFSYFHWFISRFCIRPKVAGDAKSAAFRRIAFSSFPSGAFQAVIRFFRQSTLFPPPFWRANRAFFIPSAKTNYCTFRQGLKKTPPLNYSSRLGVFRHGFGSPLSPEVPLLDRSGFA